MFIALDKLHNQGIRQAVVAVPEKAIGASFHDEPLSEHGFFADWHVEPQWNLCNAPGEEGGKVNAVRAFLDSEDRVLVCTHASFRFAVDRFGLEAFDGRLIAVDEFHHVSANPDNRLGAHLGVFIARDRVYIVAMTGSYFRGDAEPVLMPRDEAGLETVTSATGTLTLNDQFGEHVTWASARQPKLLLYLAFYGVIAKVVAVESRCGAGGFRTNISVSAPFVWWCLNGSTVAPVSTPRSSNRTCGTTASGSRTRLTPSSTARRAQAYSDARARNARRGVRVDRSHALDVWICA